MARYSPERRESVVRRMQNEAISIAALARETGINDNTLYRWRDAAKINNGEPVKSKQHPEPIAPARKFAIVLETAALNAAELAEYCRRHGLYPEQIETWRTACEQAIAGAMVPAKTLREALATQKKRNQALERELNRKDKALAETAALLTLRKKAAAIWGEVEDV